MATTTTKTTTKKSAAKKRTAKRTTAKRTTTAPRTTAQAAARTRADAAAVQRDLRTLAVDSAYATVGLGDTAVEVARSLPARASKLASDLPKTAEKLGARASSLRTDAPKWVGDLRKDGVQSVTAAVQNVEDTIGQLAGRGRKVVDSIRTARPTKRAAAQVSTASSQVKAATTSVRKAAATTAHAAEHAADKVGQGA